MGGFRHIMHSVCLVAPLLLGACANVDVHYPDGRVERMSRAQFKAYAEQVFRRQNRVVDGLIRADAESLEVDARLLHAEDAMEDACRPLIDLVSAKAEGRRMELADKLEIPRAAPACDRAVEQVEALLPTPPTF